jgi:hypothetical protein
MATTTTQEQAMKHLIEEAVAADIAAAEALKNRRWTPSMSIRYENAILAIMQADGSSKKNVETFIGDLANKQVAA